MPKSIKYIFSFIAILAVAFLYIYTYKEDFHASMYYYDNADFFKKSVESFANVKTLSPPPHIFIVNQHILAAHVIANQFALSADPNVKTVILITQNNWNAGQAPIITSKYPWKTPLGNIEPDITLADKLIKNHLATQEENIFATEHGITGIVPYVAHSFPNAKIVSLVIRDYAPAEMTDSLADELSKLDITQTAIIGTIDMSHYLPKYIADTHDDLTVQTIKEFDYQTLPLLDIDTVPTLRTVMKVAESKGMQSFVQTWHANSADITAQPDLLSTTSYISGYFSPGTSKKVNGDIHLLFTGNIMYDKGVAEHTQKYGANSLFANIDRLFLGTHAVIGNVEGKTDKQFTEFLANQHFTALNPSTVLKIQNKNVCLISYNDLLTQNTMPIINEVKNAKNSCTYIIISANWGAENLPTKTDRQKMLAHEFIDAGADIIIGVHPNVVEPIEIYKNKPIFYSLGNFLVDQDISFATKHGLALNINLGDSKNTFTLVPISIENAETQISSSADANKLLSAVVNDDILNKKQFILWNNNQ